MEVCKKLLLLFFPLLFININSQTINVPTDYSTIQEAINAANNGDVINIAAGVYNETITLNKIIEINGAGINKTTITGSVLFNALYNTGRVILRNISVITNNSPYMIETRYAIFINGAGGNTAPVTLENIEARISNPTLPTVYGTGLLISPDGNIINDVIITNCVFNNNYTHGIYIKNNLSNTGGTVSNLKIENCSLNDNDTKGGTSFYGYGLYILAPNISPTMIVNGLTVTNSTFNGHYRIGLYIESLTNASFSGVTATGNGEEGINLNLKYGSYSNLSFENCTFINNSANGITKPDIHIKGRDDGVYAGNPASLQNISISSSEFGGASFGNNITDVPIVSGNYIHSGVVNYMNSGLVDCIGNWWGSRNQEDIATMFSGSITYSPWWNNNYISDTHTLPRQWGANNNFQDAINIVAEGDTIIIAPGNYNSSFILDKYLIIAGSIAGGNNVTNIYPLGGNPVIKLNASGLSNFSPLTIRNLNIFPNFDPGKGKDGIFIGDGKNLTYISIESVNFLGTNRAYPGLESGIYVDMDASISNIEISDCSFSDLAYGIIVNKSSTSYSNFSGVSITNCYFDNNISKGMYFEKLSNATINSCIFNNNGNIGKAASWAKDFTAGLDINLKYGSYLNISISNCNFSNNGIGSLYGGALLIKARGTGNDPSYSSVVATLNGVTINNCSLNNNSADIRIGENGKSNTSPNDLNINGNVFLSTNKIIDARALPADRVNAKGNWWGTVDQGIITASVNGLIDYSPWWGANYVNDSHGTGWNWISNANLQSTINHQSILSGDTVFLTPGEYTESFTINKAITFSSLDTSNKAVIKGTGTRTYIASSGVILKDIIYNLTGDTSTDGIIVIDRGGGWPNYTIQYSNITLSGVEVLGGRRALYATVGNALIENSRFESQFRDALFFNAVSGNTIIRNNYFSGADAGKAVLFENFSSGDPAVSGSILIEDNTIEGKRNFLVYNQWQNPSVTVSIIIKKNYIAPYGTAISVYDPREFIASFDPLNFSKVNSFEVRLNRFVLNSGQKGVEGPIEIKNKIDVRRNWWGKTGGPENDALSSGINPIPWCFDEDCTKFSPINVAPGDSIKSAIDKAEDGDTIVVDMPEITEVFTIDRNVTLKFSEPPVIDSFKVYNANLTVATDITIKSGIDLSNGNIITTENAKIIFDSTAVPPVETETAKIIGIVEITPREVGSGAVQLLGLEIEPGEDNLGKVSLIRKSGNEGIVTVSGNSGISMTWDISVDNQPENGRVVKFTWLPHFDNGINPSSVIVYRNTGSGWEYYAGPFNADGNPREVIINAMGFSSWTIGGSDAPLPVELIYFGANVVNNNINLIWHTATETSNYGFEIERFVKLIDDDWQKIGFVQGSGNSYSPKEYLFIDENPPAGVINYRLKQIDFDGSFEYYQYIAEVNFSLTRIEENEVLDEYKLYQNYPNPFNPLTTIKYVVPATGRGDIASQNILLIVYDLLGREIAVLVNEPKKPGIYIVEFNGSNLSSGIYLYTLQSGNYRAVRKLLLMK